MLNSSALRKSFDSLKMAFSGKANLAVEYTPMGMWAKLNELGYFENDGQPWQPNARQWGWFNWLIKKIYNKEGFAGFLACRRVGKTEIMVIFAMVYLIYTRPTFTCILITAERSRGITIIENVREMLLALGVKLRGKARTKIRRIENKKKEDNVTCKGASSSLRGFHVDFLAMDDLLEEKDGYSNAKLTRAKKVVSESMNISDTQLLIGQRVNENDLFTNFSDKIDLLESWVGDNLDIVTMTKEKYLESSTLRSWGMNYEGIFYPDNETIFSAIEIVDDIPVYRVHAVIDPAYGGTDSTGFCILGLNAKQDKLVAIVFEFKSDWSNALDAIVTECKKYRVEYLYYEGIKVNKPIYNELLRRYNISAYGFNTAESKIKKIQSVKAFVVAKYLALSSHSSKNAISAVVSWHPMAKNDDVADALAMAVKIYNGG